MTPAPRKLPALRGGHWLRSAFDTVRQRPSVFLLMGLIAGLIGGFPFVGGLALLIAGPAFIGGTLVAAHTQAAGGKPEWSQLLALFQEPTQRKEALKLCLPVVAGKLTAGVVLGLAMAVHVTQSGMDVTKLEGDWDKLFAILTSPAMFVWLLVAALIVLFAWTFTILAIPAVALHRQPAFPAMAAGFRRVWHNLGPWLVALVALLAVMLAVSSLLGLTGMPALVQLGFHGTLYTLLGPMLLAAWRDLAGTPPPPPTGAAAPPPPSGVLKA